MHSMNDERFFDLAMKVIARQQRVELHALRVVALARDDLHGQVEKAFVIH